MQRLIGEHHPAMLVTFFLILQFTIHVNGYLDHNGMCSQQERTCSKMCRAIAECSAPGVSPILRGCYGRTPYCFQGHCTDMYQPDCNQDYMPVFNCSANQNGIFPDPFDCKRFHMCLNGIAFSGDCNREPGLIYSTKTHSCVRENGINGTNRCGSIDCRNKTNVYAIYSTDPRYAGKCIQSKSNFVFQCPPGYEFSEEYQQCEFKCTAEGLFPDYDEFIWFWNTSDDHQQGAKYFECSLSYGTTYLITKRFCPNDEFVQSVFDPKISECVPTNTMNENSTIPWPTYP